MKHSGYELNELLDFKTSFTCLSFTIFLTRGFCGDALLLRYYLDGGKKEIGEGEEEEDTDSDEEGLGLKESATMSDVGSEDETDGDAVNPLLTDLVGDSKELRKARKAENWFSQVRESVEFHLFFVRIENNGTFSVYVVANIIKDIGH